MSRLRFVVVVYDAALVVHGAADYCQRRYRRRRRRGRDAGADDGDDGASVVRFSVGDRRRRRRRRRLCRLLVAAVAAAPAEVQSRRASDRTRTLLPILHTRSMTYTMSDAIVLKIVPKKL